MSTYSLVQFLRRLREQQNIEHVRALYDELIQLYEIAIQHNESGPTIDSDYRIKLRTLQSRRP